MFDTEFHIFKFCYSGALSKFCLVLSFFSNPKPGH